MSSWFILIFILKIQCRQSLQVGRHASNKKHLEVDVFFEKMYSTVVLPLIIIQVTTEPSQVMSTAASNFCWDGFLDWRPENSQIVATFHSQRIHVWYI